MRNNGFGLITNKLLRDEIIKLFENTYRTIISVDETFKLQNNYHQEIVSGHLYYDKPYSLKPFDFEELIKSKRYYSLVSGHQNNYQWMKQETMDGLSETKESFNF